MNWTSASNQTLTLVLGGPCAHVFDVALGCEPHNYEHIWGWACSKCWQQVFYTDLALACCLSGLEPMHQPGVISMKPLKWEKEGLARMDACAWQSSEATFWREILYDMGWAQPVANGSPLSSSPHRSYASS